MNNLDRKVSISFHTITLLMPASVLGVLARLGLQKVGSYDGQSIFSLALAQSVGCVIMGAALELREPLTGIYGPLYTAITTGFCGSLTTFSSWQFDVFSSWINADQFQRPRIYNFIDGVLKIAFTLSISFGSLAFGRHLSANLRPYFTKTLPGPSKRTRYSATAVGLLVYAATVPAYLLLSPTFRPKATAAMLFSFPGTLVRYVLGLYLNPLTKKLPFGTLSANVLGTALLGGLHALQNKHPVLSDTDCSLIQGMEDGFCGCMTTVSTFVAEGTALNPGRRWSYVLVSVVVSQFLLVLVFGLPYWTSHVDSRIACRFVL